MILVVNKITLTWHLYFRSFLLSLLGKGTHFGLLRRPGGLEKLEKFTFAAGCCHTPEILFKIFCARLTWNHLLILLHLVEISSISLYQFIDIPTKIITNLLKDCKILIIKVFFLYQKSAKSLFSNMTIGEQLLLLTNFDNLEF